MVHCHACWLQHESMSGFVTRAGGILNTPGPQNNDYITLTGGNRGDTGCGRPVLAMARKDSARTPSGRHRYRSPRIAHLPAADDRDSRIGDPVIGSVAAAALDSVCGSRKPGPTSSAP